MGGREGLNAIYRARPNFSSVRTSPDSGFMLTGIEPSEVAGKAGPAR